MDFQELCVYLQRTFDEYPETNIKRVNRLTRKMKELYPETEEVASQMNKALYSCAVDLVLGGMNPRNYFPDGRRKAFKTIVTSGGGEPLRYAVLYEDDQFYPYAKFVIPKGAA